MTNVSKHTLLIKSIAKDLGFDFVGISKAEKLQEEEKSLENWLQNNFQANMSYMENHFDKRLDPTLLVDGAKSVVSLMYNYYPQENQPQENQIKFSKYAYGEDYHFVIKDKLKEFFHIIQEQIGEVNGRAFVDSAPVLERAWAKKSGLGWIGKNSMLINKQQGSFFFLAELIIDLELEADGPIKDYCGTCTKCIDACPTDAIIGDRVIDANKCISYLTIELRDDKLPEKFKNKMENWAFGCDICQDVCPWNRFSKAHQEKRFVPREVFLEMKKEDWLDLNEEQFQTIFKKTAVKRTKYNGLKRNLDFL